MTENERTLPADAPVMVRSHRRPSWLSWMVVAAGYVLLGGVAHLAKPILTDLSMITYAVAEVGGIAFLVRYARTEWRTHAWGRHVMAFMVCLEVLFTLTLSAWLFGPWPGLMEAGFLASVTFTGIVWWRYMLQARGDRRARELRNLPDK